MNNGKYKTTGVARKLAIMKSRVARGHYNDGLTSFAKIGAKYWKRMSGAQRQNYLSTMLYITKDNENFDPHLGDANFQNKIIGSVGHYIEIVKRITSSYYQELYKRKKGFPLAISFPEILLEKIEKDTGSYKYDKLLKRDATYQVNPEVEDSRTRRYTNVKESEGNIKWRGKPKPLPVHPEAKELIFKQLDLLWYGFEVLQNMDVREQHELIVQGLAPNTNSGYPEFTTQTKDNISTMFWDWAIKNCSPVLVKYDELKEERLLSIQLIFDCVTYCDQHGIYEPSVNFYRTQFDKVRSVFGGTVLLKTLGAAVHAAKVLGYTKEATESLGYPSVSHWDRQLISKGGLPIMAQLDWSVMFKDILQRMPKIKNGKLEPMSPSDLMNLFGFKSDKERLVDVVGEDIKAYDTGVILEDLLFLIDHPKLGFIMKFVLNWLDKSEVWVGDLRLFDIFFKSGHPWTSDMGSFNHINMAFIIRDYIRKKKGDCELLSFTVLSDDSLFWWIGFDLKLAIECMDYYGYKIKEEASFIFSRDKIVSFLKVLVGYVLSEDSQCFVGDFQSRYLKLAHSEREIEQDLNDPDKYKAEMIGIYKVTGDIEIDSFLSKLASFGEEGDAVQMEILRIVKDTTLGMKAIRVILGMKSSDDIELYRKDVLASFHVRQLAKLPVLSLLNNRLLPVNS